MIFYLHESQRPTDSTTAARKLALRASVLAGFLCAVIATEVASAQVESTPSSVASDGRDTSIWTYAEFDSSGSVESGGLNTGASGPDGRQEPILVPLPAPILAAGTGLGLAWILRKRITRS